MTARSENTALESIEQALAAELECVKDFLMTLQQESRVLSEGAEPEQLNSVTINKNNCIDALNKITTDRNKLLNDMGFASDRDGLLELAQQYGNTVDVVQSLLDTTAQASILNHGNGQIIDRFLNNHQQALDVLYHLTGRSQLYDAKGRAKPTTKPRTGHNKRV